MKNVLLLTAFSIREVLVLDFRVVKRRHMNHSRQSRRNRLSLLSGGEKGKSVDYDDKLVHSDKEGGNTSTSEAPAPETPPVTTETTPPTTTEPVEVCVCDSVMCEIVLCV